MPKLIIGSTAHELTEDCVTIGRAPDNAIVLGEPSVSNHHAELRLTGKTYILKDLGSTNGTHVNGIPVMETALYVNDCIRFGAVEARYESGTSGCQPLPTLEEIVATPAQSSAKPIDFGNASPFPRRQKQREPIRNALFAAAVVALLTFFGSMIAVLMMRT
ncbi:MAG: FHA domain-containing protein [Chthoniobacterales bacterium]